MLREIEKIKGVKKVFVRSGIRFDYLILDEDDTFFRQLVTHHTSGQLKVAPEHCALNALTMMGKPPVEVFEKFKKKFFKISEEAGLEQYLVPYLMSSHPGATMKDAVDMALWLKQWGYSPEQVQDFYPTPGTISTVMYYTGIHPMTGKNVYVTTDYHEKQLQRALLQYSRPENANLVREALKAAGREDLIGTGPECLVRPAFGQDGHTRYIPSKKGNKSSHSSGKNSASAPKSKSAQQPVKYYQPVLDAKKPKKSKLERIFGEEASRIRIESARISDKSQRGTASNRPKGQTPPSQKGANVTKRSTKQNTKSRGR